MEFSKEIQLSVEAGFELLKQVLQPTFEFFKGKYAENDPFGIATKRYIGGLLDRYNLVKVLGMREPVPLKKLFVRANILEKISARTGHRLEELEAFFDSDRRTFGINKETVDGEIIVNKLQRFIVLGKPGAGKTTYLKYLTLMMLEPLSQIERRRLPIFVTLREWVDEQMPLKDFMVNQFDICHFPEAERFLEKMLSDGECVVLFDGLDEVSQESNQDNIIRQIKNFCDKYNRNQFIVSCRVAAYNHWFESFTDIEMADFNEEQIETFIKNWFYKEPKVGKECWERLKKSPPLKELASVPLLLTLLCLEYSESNDFPPNRAELYQRAIETLLTKWDSSRRIRRGEVYKQLSVKRKESMFARIAFNTFGENMYFIKENTLAKMIENYIKNLPGFDEKDLEPDSRAILKAIESHHGIFVERAKGVYSFAHLTFQEYFTARHIVDNQLHGALERLVKEHLYDPKWKEVFLLVAGMLDNADELFLLMRQQADEASAAPEIQRLFQVVEKALLPSESRYSKVLRRCFGIYSALALVLAGTHARSLHHARARARARARALVRARVLNIDIDIEIDLAIARASALALELDLDLDNDLDLDFDLNIDLLDTYSKAHNVTSQTAWELEKYFSANELILKCLESGCYVTKPIREKMIHEMFLPKESDGGSGA